MTGSKKANAAAKSGAQMAERRPVINRGVIFSQGLDSVIASSNFGFPCLRYDVLGSGLRKSRMNKRVDLELQG